MQRVTLLHLCQQLGRKAVEVDADAEGQPVPVLKARQALAGNLLADDVDGGKLAVLKQLAHVELRGLGEEEDRTAMHSAVPPWWALM